MNKDRIKEALLELATDIQNDPRDVKFVTFGYVKGEIVCKNIEYE